MDLKERVKALCDERGISLRKLSVDCGLSPTSIAKWDVHAPNIEAVSKVAEYFGVSINYLVTGEEASLPQIDYAYLSLAKDAQDEGIAPEDIRKAIEFLKEIKNGGL